MLDWPIAIGPVSIEPWQPHYPGILLAAYTYQLLNTSFPQYDFHGQHASPSEIWIFYDGDDPTSSDPTLQNNDYPDSGDNHGIAGENVAFCDGHVEWVPQKKYLRSWFRGNDEAHAPIK